MMDGQALKQVVRNSSLKSFEGENYMEQKILTGKKLKSELSFFPAIKKSNLEENSFLDIRG